MGKRIFASAHSCTSLNKEIQIMPPLRSLALMALVSATAACGSSSFNSTWANTRAQPVDMTGKKVVAVVRVAEDARRRASEDELARELTSRGAQGIPSYKVFPGASAQGGRPPRGQG